MGNYLNGVSIDGIINILNNYKSFLKKELNDSIQFDHVFNATGGNPYRQSVKDWIKEIDNQLNPLNQINKNTVYPLTFVDAFALKEALENYGSPIESVDILPMWNDSNLNPDDSNPDYFIMVIYFSRFAMNGHGFHIGYENVTFNLKLYSKREMGLSGIPYNLSHLVCIPDVTQLEIVNRILPDEELPDESHHEKDCEVFQRSLLHPWNPENEPFPDDCTCECNDNWEVYSHPDDDFLYNEMESVFTLIMQYSINDLPEAEFDSESRTWSLNERKYTVGNEKDEWWIG